MYCIVYNNKYIKSYKLNILDAQQSEHQWLNKNLLGNIVKNGSDKEDMESKNQGNEKTFKEKDMRIPVS